ncbi:DNA glycosylase AlkZ-like family protein [Deinococcus sp. S9]|uniref:DNA glycosylase AlkZ-like family protein n=1 Tax=Deinococcus sp. S9 TaxID=2545754 RepID=UPI00105454F9|nr:crosslink repair DNA glycosylase YcaQ family protein [Deinococcus sp. S9]TDE86029.1 winged helix-turn-helix domain-containing protein [Deinococcus sp. S9]
MPDHPAPLTPATLRAFAWHTLKPHTSLQAALDALGFVQADPIRAPARAQDLTLLQRVRGYRAGDLERLYPTLDAEEDMLPNYGFVTRRVQALLHPRELGETRVEREHPGLLAEVRALVQDRAEVHPREVAAAVGRGRVVNAWGGQSAATTRALDVLHRRGEVRVTRRVGGTRLYGPAPHLAALREAPLPTPERVRGAVHLLAALYGPLPEASLGYLVSLSRFGLPHLHSELRAASRTAMREELTGVKVDGVRYVWPAEWDAGALATPRGVRIIGPFDPLVWDRRRFTHLHGWTYRFEAYTPAEKRQFGYYALPVFQAARAVGWANLKVEGGELRADLHFMPGVRETAALKKGLAAELERYRRFLGLDAACRHSSSPHLTPTP